jgi:hypothetical protein
LDTISLYFKKYSLSLKNKLCLLTNTPTRSSFPSNPSFFFDHVEPVGDGATRLLCPPHHLFLASGVVLVSDLVLCDRSLVVVFGSLRRRPAFGATLMFWIGCFMVEVEAFSFLGGFSGLGVLWWVSLRRWIWLAVRCGGMPGGVQLWCSDW